jgi:hypothetical protein
MNRTLFAILAVVLVPLPAAAQGQQVFHQNVNGITLFGGTSNGSVQVFRNVAGGVDSPQYTILYQIGTCDSGYPIQTCVGQAAYGLVSGSAVQANAQNAHVHVDTSTLPGFVSNSYRELIDFSSGFPTIIEVDTTPTPGPVLDLSWRANNQFQSSSSGSTKQIQPGIGTTTVSGGTQSYTTATVQGSVNGAPITGFFGTIGSTHTSSVTITTN